MDHPFEYGAVYRVRATFEAPRDTFHADEIIVYWRHGQSVYHGMQGYFFRVPGSADVRAWDLSLGADTRGWSELFERVADPAPVVVAALAGEPEAAAAAALREQTALSALSVELAVLAAAERGSATVVQALVHCVSDASRLAGRLLHHAAGAGHVEVVRVLLDAGSPPDQADVLGQTPLILAASAGAVDTVALLLSRGANPSAATRGGVTARALALSRHHTEVVALLDEAVRNLGG